AVRIRLAEEFTFCLVLIVLRKAFVKPVMESFVRGKHALKPAVGHLVKYGTYGAGGSAFADNKRSHRIFHTSVTPLYYRVGLIRIGSNVVLHELEKARRDFGKAFPVLCFRVRLIKEVKLRSTRHTVAKVAVIGVGSPHKIVHVLRPEAPGKGRGLMFDGFSRLIAVTDRVGIYKHARACDRVPRIQGDVHLVVVPHRMKFTGYVLIEM